MPTPPKHRDVSGLPDEPKSAAPAGKSCFLGIGIDAYQHFGKLHNAVRDMEAVRDLLMADYDLEKKHCRTIKDVKATRKEVLRELRNLDSWVAPDDKLIIYYSGHGHLNRHKRGFWVPVDAEKGAEEDYISNAVLREILSDVPARHILLISDSCFSGALFVRGADRADAANDELELRASRWALCSGRHNELVADGEPGKHSPFADSILSELRHSRQAALRIGTLAERVIELTRANYEQLPEGAPLQGVGHQGGQYVFRRKIDEAALRQQNAQNAWLAIQALPDETLKEIRLKRQRIRSFCREYPNTEPYDDALRSGRDLEHKDELLSNWHSEFGLLDFIRKDTAYRGAAQRRLDELSADSTPMLRPRPVPKPTPSPKPRRVFPPKAKWAAMGISALVVLVLLVVGIWRFGGGTLAPPDYAAIQQLRDNMVHVEGGSFTMGCKDGRDKDCYDNENPTRTVQVSGYSIGKYEVTQAQWRAVMGSDPSYNKGCDNCPVEQVSWNDLQKFIKKLNALTGQRYRLPTEAEWEYAARGGQKGKANNYQYSGSNNIGEVAWYNSNAKSGNTHGNKKTTRPVGDKKPNELGLYDMSGNVWEWCADWYGKYPSKDEVNPKGPASASHRVARGGSWYDNAVLCRTAFRPWYPSHRDNYLGFRLALSLEAG